MVNRRKQKGLAMVEFAVALPFLLLMITVVSELGFLMVQQNTLIKSVEAGGRYISVSAKTGTGFIDINAHEIQDTRNMVLYGNTAGVGDPVINDLKIININIACFYGIDFGHCQQNSGITPITITANFRYTPILGNLFNNVTGFNYFPITLSAITIVESI